MAFLVIKAKIVLKYKIGSFFAGWFFIQKAYYWFPTFPGFRFFAIEHIRKPGNHGKFSEAHFSRYWVYLYDFEHFPKHFVCSRQNSQGVAQSHQGALTCETWN